MSLCGEVWLSRGLAFRVDLPRMGLFRVACWLCKDREPQWCRGTIELALPFNPLFREPLVVPRPTAPIRDCLKMAVVAKLRVRPGSQTTNYNGRDVLRALWPGAEAEAETVSTVVARCFLDLWP